MSAGAGRQGSRGLAARNGQGSGRQGKDGNGPGSSGRITRDDIAAKLRSVSGQAGPPVEMSKSVGAWALAAAVGIGIVGAYVVGRRRGRRSRAVIEIRRV